MHRLFAALAVAAAFLIAAPAAHAVETTLTVQEISVTGLAPSYASAAAGGNNVLINQSDQRTFVQVKNASGSSINVTLVAQTTSAVVPGAGTVTIADKVIAVPSTTGDKMIGPIPEAYIDSSGYAHLTFSAVTSVTVAAIHMARASN